MARKVDVFLSRRMQVGTKPRFGHDAFVLVLTRPPARPNEVGSLRSSSVSMRKAAYWCTGGGDR